MVEHIYQLLMKISDIYIYHALIDVLNVHMVHVNLKTIFYTHVEQGPTNAIHLKYYLKQKKIN